MNNFKDDKTLEALKKAREGIDGLINLYEKNDNELTEDEVERVTGKFIISMMGLESLK